MVKPSPPAQGGGDLAGCDWRAVGLPDAPAVYRGIHAFGQHLVDELAGIGLRPEANLTPAPAVRGTDDAPFLGQVPHSLVDHVAELRAQICDDLGRADGPVRLAQHLGRSPGNACDILRRPARDTARRPGSLLTASDRAGLP